jgi:4-amino-4-deoxy-L-arabinose transferase-like glycosyltransferase
VSHQRKLNRYFLSPGFLWGLVVLGSVFRFAQYLYNRSLWVDESMLATNIITLPFAKLLEPLHWDQAAPAGYLAATKTSVLLFGTGEFVLRLLPLLSGILSLLLFLFVARRVMSPEAAPWAVLLFAVADPLIYYSSEVKPYSGDVAVGLLLTLLALRWMDDPSNRGRATILLLVGALSVWFSFGAPFFLAGVGLVMLLGIPRERVQRRVLTALLASLLWGLSFALYYLLSLSSQIESAYLQSWWSRMNGFLPFPPQTLAEAGWPIRKALEVFRNPAGLKTPILPLLFAIVGTITLARRRGPQFVLLAGPILAALVASALHRYPFHSRLILFLAPALILLVAEGLAVTFRYSSRPSLLILTVALSLAVVVPPTWTALQRLIHPRQVEEIRPLVEYLHLNRRAGDTLYVYWLSRVPYRYYAGRLGMTEWFVAGEKLNDDPARIISEIEPLLGKGRVWFLFSGKWRKQGKTETEDFVEYLAEHFRELDRKEETGAVTVLYDLGSPPANR